jgi:uncharacterized protein YjiK
MIDQVLNNATRKGRNICLLVLSAIVFFIASCGSGEEIGHFPSPAGYNLNKPIVVKLPPMLDEISGIFYYPKDKSLFAIHDERGWLYKIYTDKKNKIEKWKYTQGADFEDVAMADSMFFAIKSNGNIVAFSFKSPDSPVVKSFKIEKSDKREFETLYFDSTRQQLLMICKDCEADEKNMTSVFAFDYKQMKYLDSPVFYIDAKHIEKKLGEKIPKFKPSAGAINPRTGELFAISSVNKILVVAENDGKVKDVFQLDPKLFKQPEGLTFTPSGDLLISNESAGIGPATILLFKYKESPQQ